MFSIFAKGGLVMWPLLFTSLAAVATVIERILFIINEKKARRHDLIEQILNFSKQGQYEQAITAGQDSQDFVVRTMVYALRHREDSFSNAVLLASSKELQRFSRGLSTLDTIITLAPLLGLFGTVTGMIGAFGLLGAKGLDAPTVITGGIAEALIATAFGLIVAIISLIPFNYLNRRLEEARQEIQDTATQLELLLLKNMEKK